MPDQTGPAPAIASSKASPSVGARRIGLRPRVELAISHQRERIASRGADPARSGRAMSPPRQLSAVHGCGENAVVWSRVLAESTSAICLLWFDLRW